MRQGVPLLCRALRSDQLQVLDFLNRASKELSLSQFESIGYAAFGSMGTSS